MNSQPPNDVKVKKELTTDDRLTVIAQMGYFVKLHFDQYNAVFVARAAHMFSFDKTLGGAVEKLFRRITEWRIDEVSTDE